MSFSTGDNAGISLALSKANIQSRFIGEFEVLSQLVDTPKSTVQGFIVNKNCDHIKTIFLRNDDGVIFKNNNLWLFIDSENSLGIEESIVSTALAFQVCCLLGNKLKLFQVEYKSEFEEFNAMPISEMFIVKRFQDNTTQWKLFDAYKLNHGYDIEISENGIIEAIEDTNELKVSGANFSSARRQNLQGVNVTCGLVVFMLFPFLLNISTVFFFMMSHISFMF